MYRYTIYNRISRSSDYRISSHGDCAEFELVPDADPDPCITEFVVRFVAGVGSWRHIIWEIKPSWMIIVKDESNNIVYSSFEDIKVPTQRRNPEHGLQLYDDYGNEIDAI